MTAYLTRMRQWPAPLAGVLFYCGERLWPGTPARPVLTGLGAGILLGLLGWNLWVWWKSQPGSRVRTLAGWQALPPALFAAGGALYLVGLTFPETAQRPVDWPGLLGWAWMLALLLGAVVFIFLELATSGGAAQPQPERIRRAAQAGAFVGLLLALLVTLNFIFERLEVEWDFTFFRASHPSQPTLDLVAALDGPVDIALVFAEDSPVPSLMGGYFNTLEKASSQVKIARFDSDLEPARARSFRSRSNGVVVVRRKGKRKEIQVGETLERARNTLRKLDGQVFGALVEVAADKETIYFTTGHGEPSRREAPQARIPRSQNRFRTLLQERNFTVKELGVGEGLGREVPQDAAMVVVMAPSAAFLPGELLALRDYLDKGGNLLAFLEPGNGPGEAAGGGSGTVEELLRDYGVVYEPVAQANDRFFVRYSYTQADRGLLVTGEYSPHPFQANQPRRRNRPQKPLLLLNTGAFQKRKPPEGMEVREVVKGMKGTWGDLNRNFAFDAPREKKAEPALVLSVSPAGKKDAPGPRIVAFADSDFVMDFLMQNIPNQELMVATVDWLSRGDGAAGLPETDEDVRILHAKADELVWFYLPVFGVPLLVLGLGYFLSIRRNRQEG